MASSSLVQEQQQYCLKWNNHPSNISSVFHRLRHSEQFVDVTLASSDRKLLKCHRVLLCAGSGYLEDLLRSNPSDHPTLVLSQIRFTELRMLVDFMYAGEVAVEQGDFSRLIEAARVLRIKGLWDCEEQEQPVESPIQKEPDNTVGDVEEEEEVEIDPREDSGSVLKGKPPTSASSSLDSILGAKLLGKPKVAVSKRKRKASAMEAKKTDVAQTNDTNSKTPLFGVSNAYFLSEQTPFRGATSPSKLKKTKKSKETTINKAPEAKKTFSDIPVLMPQVPFQFKNDPPKLPLPDFLTELASKNTKETSKNGDSQAMINNMVLTSQSIGCGLLASTPVRRYKQYTEETLQQALKEIMDGQSINRSSMKFNIPARTLRDWMKRLNIQSVFTHHSNGKKRATSLEEDEETTSVEVSSNDDAGSIRDGKLSPGLVLKTSTGIAFPGMTAPESQVSCNISPSAFPGMTPEAQQEQLDEKKYVRPELEQVKKEEIDQEEEEIDDVEEEEIDDAESLVQE